MTVSPLQHRCAWDRQAGLITLFRDDWHQSQPGYLVLSIATRDIPQGYFAGLFPRKQHVWVVRAPDEDRFTLRFFTRDEAEQGFNLDRELHKVEFDSSLVFDPDQPLPPDHRGMIWLFRSQEGQLSPPEMIRVKHDLATMDFLPRELEAHHCSLSDPIGLAGTLFDETNTQGPTIQLFDNTSTMVDVYVGCNELERSPTENPLGLEDFNTTTIPYIEVDLTPFGPAAEYVQEAFCFLHLPLDDYGSENAGLAPVYGGDLPLSEADEEGRRFLVHEFEGCCHRDILGVFFKGGERMRIFRYPCTDSSVTEPELEECFAQTPCAAFLFIGDDFRPVVEMADAWREGGEGHCPSIDSNMVNRIRYSAWLLSIRAANDIDADFSGAEGVNPFTLYSYAWFIQQTHSFDPAQFCHLALFKKSGFKLEEFESYLQYPELLYRLVIDSLCKERLKETSDLALERYQPHQRLLINQANILGSMDGDTLTWLQTQLAVGEEYFASLLFARNIDLNLLKRHGIKPDSFPSHHHEIEQNITLAMDDKRRRIARLTMFDLGRGRDAAKLETRPVYISQVSGVAEIIRAAERTLDLDEKNAVHLIRHAKVPLVGSFQSIVDKIAEALDDNTDLESREKLLASIALRAREAGVSASFSDNAAALETRAGLTMIGFNVGSFAVIRHKAAPVYKWAHGVLRGEPRPDLVNSPRLTASDIEIQGLQLREIEMIISITPADRPLAPPTWSESRKAAYDLVLGRMRRGLTEQQAFANRVHSELAGKGVDASGEGPLRLLTRMERLLPWLASRLVWRKIVENLGELIRNNTEDNKLITLWTRTSGPPSTWDRIGKELERLHPDSGIMDFGEDPDHQIPPATGRAPHSEHGLGPAKEKEGTKPERKSLRRNGLTTLPTSKQD